MFNKIDVNKLIEENKILKEKIDELQNNLIEVANNSGACIIKQLPNGVIELNGEPIDKDMPVDYYNSSQATYGELTMYRVAKEAFKRDEKKLINIHLEECDNYKNKIVELSETIEKLKVDINRHCEFENKQNIEISDLNDLIRDLNNKKDKQEAEYKSEKEIIINKYKGMINALEEDIATWKERYLKLNNIKPDGTIITKYGEVIANN